jgi:hypothetical protein
MIIELFGPPGVGKTTLASALGERLRERGRDIKLVLSYRPSEAPRAAPGGSLRPCIPAALSRLVRPMVECFAAAGHFAEPGERDATAELMRLLAPRNIVQSLRLRQYLLRLSRTWRNAAQAADIVLLDQGFVQALHTFVLLARVADRERLGLALGTLPEADLLVRLDAPLPVLEARLAGRRRRQGKIEQLFDAWTNLQSLWVFDQLYELLRARNRPVTRVDTADRHSLGVGVDRLESIILGIHGGVRAASGLTEEDYPIS